MMGYVVLALFDDGSYRFANRLANEAPVPLTLWPSYVAEALRREMVTASEVRHVINNEYIVGEA